MSRPHERNIGRSCIVIDGANVSVPVRKSGLVIIGMEDGGPYLVEGFLGDFHDGRGDTTHGRGGTEKNCLWIYPTNLQIFDTRTVSKKDLGDNLFNIDDL
jgi:hypothetical protein